MKKIVINSCRGGFGLSHEAVMRYAEIKGLNLYPDAEIIKIAITYFTVPLDQRGESPWDHHFDIKAIARDGPSLVQVIEELGDAANNKYSVLKIVEIPDDVKWEIAEYDGWEWVAEKHRTWG